MEKLRTGFCYKILPLAYDDSLSYYEVNCKIRNKVNEIINYIGDNMETLIREQLDNLFINAMYDATTETLILRLGVRDNG